METCVYDAQGALSCSRPKPCPKETYATPACNRPSNWCTHSGSVFKAVDCLGDGIAGDLYCSDRLGQTGSILRSNGCTATWPNAEPCKRADAPGGIVPFPIAPGCSRPSNWCTHRYSNLKQCDALGNGENGDFVCTDSYGNTGTILRKNNCESVWPQAPIPSGCS